MKNHIVVLSCLLSATAFAVDNTYTGPKVELTFIHGYTASDRIDMENLVKKFNESHPNISVKASAVAWGTTYQQIGPLVAAGKAPDVLAMTENVINNFVAKNAVAEITAADLKKLGIKSSNYYKNLWAGGTYKNKVYGVPFSQVSVVMFYNQNLLDKYGIKKLPKTYKEFLAAAQKCTVDQNGKKPGEAGFDQAKLATYGWGVSHNAAGALFTAYGAVRSFGGNTVDKDFNPDFNSPEAVKAIQTYVDFVTKHQVSPAKLTDDTAVSDFRGGKSCFNTNGAWMYNFYSDAKNIKLGVAFPPALGSKPSAWGAHTHLVLPRQKDSYDANKRAAALEFIRFMTDKEQMLAFTESGALPTQPAVANDPRYAKNPFAPIKNNLKNIYIPTGWPWVDQVQNAMFLAVENAILGKKSVQDALNDGVKEAEKNVNEARQSLGL
ncbi:ABC transporter substrate-binding protein [Deinococcus misasensis]|uniref:ABC transporter substrate-binding protein n=1 Tax=Deinococcus misasensis TaxID=392413 RepID=UPI000553D081|nr:ABC transporter substrate-binding protein [Deinococcus misasensis]